MKKILLLLFILSALILIYSLSHKNYKDILYSDLPDNITKVEVDTGALNNIEANIGEIVKWSQYYNLDPRAIGGIIIAEKCLHRGPVNYFEQYYVEAFFLSKTEDYLQELVRATKAKVENKKLKGESDQDFEFRLRNGLIWTIGLCQISIMKGLEIDSLIAIDEKREPRTVKANIRGLLNPASNIQYCAFELKEICDKFKNGAGLDITREVGILCTLYNTGKVSESIIRYNKTKLFPRANDFGKFAESKLALIDSIMNGD